MRSNIDPQTIERLMNVLGKEARGSGAVFFTGGASALLIGWRDRSIFIARKGQISFYHYDFTAQALSTLSRGYDHDVSDVIAMYKQRLFSLKDLCDCFEAIEPELIRFPALSSESLRRKIEDFVEQLEKKSEDRQQ